MNGFTLLFILLSGCLFNSPAIAKNNNDKEKHVLILKSKESSFYDQTIQSSIKNLGKTILLLEKNINSNPSLKNSSLIISLGIKAAKYTRQHNPNTPHILAFITLEQSKNLGIYDNEVHLLIEQHPTHYINFANTLLPSSSIGVLFQSNNTDWIQYIINNPYNQIQLIQRTSHSNIIRATRKIIQKSDVLLALPDKDIFNRHTLKGILLSTYQSNKAFISYSPAHVKAGAIAAIYSSTQNIGHQIADMTKNIFNKKAVFKKRFYAKYFSIKINPRVAISLGLKLPSIKALRRSNQLLRENNG